MNRAFQPRPFLYMLAVPCFALLCGLGVWQLQRLAWKNDLLAAQAAREATPALDIDSSHALVGLAECRVEIGKTFASNFASASPDVTRRALDEFRAGWLLYRRALELAGQLARLPDLTLRYSRILLTQRLKRLLDEGIGHGLALEGLGALEMLIPAASPSS